MDETQSDERDTPSVTRLGEQPAPLSRRSLFGYLASAPALLAAACGIPGQAQPDAQSAAPVTLEWMTDWAGGVRGETSKQSVPAFEAEHPKIKLDMRAAPADTYEAFAANLAAGTLPDVMLFSGNLFEYWAEKGAFADISSLLRKNRWDRESVWWQPQYFENKGRTHGLPYQFTISTWVYNKTWFRQSGVALPTDAWTTDDLLEAARKLNRSEENKWALQMNHEPAYAWIWVYANGADLTTQTEPIRTAIGDPKPMEVWQYAVELIHRHRVAPVPGGPNQTRGVAGFQAGGYAITVNNSAKALGASIRDQFEWDVMPTPRWAATKRRFTNWNHQGHIVMKQAEQRGRADAATQFAMWMAGEPGQTLVAKAGGATPVNKKTANSAVYLDGTPPGLKLQLDLLTKKSDQEARGFRIYKHFNPWFSVIRPILGEGFNGEISVREMGIKATQAGNAALENAYRSG
jgi:multiple sugar transport system substrate-binding protein